MHEAESQALELAQEAAIDRFGPDHRFTAEDICELHRPWLGPIYAWAGTYRSVNIGKGGFQFAHAPLIAGLMRELERGALARLHCRHSRGHGAQLRADDCRVRQSYRAVVPTRRFQYAMKAAVLDGALALLPLEKGARIPSTAEDV
jgi:hypothetical protein